MWERMLWSYGELGASRIIKRGLSLTMMLTEGITYKSTIASIPVANSSPPFLQCFLLQYLASLRGRAEYTFHKAYQIPIYLIVLYPASSKEKIQQNVFFCSQWSCSIHVPFSSSVCLHPGGTALNRAGLGNQCNVTAASRHYPGCHCLSPAPLSLSLAGKQDQRGRSRSSLLAVC